jgi:excinuclease ABC subunit C
MTDGELDKARYRRFKVKGLTAQDDFASMHEVLGRRIARGLKEQDLPDLIVVDGGKGQLASAHAALQDCQVDRVDLVALAKSRELDEAGRVGPSEAPARRSPERLFLVGRKDPIVLPQNSPELFLLTRLRDEAHRFAITFQQKLMRRRNFRSQLESVPGVGEGRKTALLRQFGSLKRVREASIEALSEVVGPAIAERLHTFLHEADPPQEAAEDEVREASLEDAEADVQA